MLFAPQTIREKKRASSGERFSINIRYDSFSATAVPFSTAS
jgi:hypothetical protein